MVQQEREGGSNAGALQQREGEVNDCKAREGKAREDSGGSLQKGKANGGSERGNFSRDAPRVQTMVRRFARAGEGLSASDGSTETQAGGMA